MFKSGTALLFWEINKDRIESNSVFSTLALHCKFYFPKWIIRSFLTVAFTIPFVEMLIFDFLPEFSMNHCKALYASQGNDTPGALFFSSPFPEERDHHCCKDVLNQGPVLSPVDISNLVCKVQT